MVWVQLIPSPVDSCPIRGLIDLQVIARSEININSPSSPLKSITLTSSDLIHLSNPACFAHSSTALTLGVLIIINISSQHRLATRYHGLYEKYPVSLSEN